LLVVWGAAAYGADSSAALAARQAQAKKQQGELRARIGTLQKTIDEQEASRRDAADALSVSESAISSSDRRLHELTRQKQQAQADLDELQTQTSDQKKLLAQRQRELADQLRAQYTSGLSPWTALLSGDDPHAIGRDLSYLGYISRAQANAVRAVRTSIDTLASLQARTKARQQELAEVVHETAKQKAALSEQKEEREKVLAKIETALTEQRTQAQTLDRNEKRLGQLVSGLETAIAEQLEAERRAEEKRKAEEARKAEAARQAAIARRREIERQREAALLAQQQAAQAQANAQREQDAQKAQAARLQVEQARIQSKAAEEAARSEAASSAAARAASAPAVVSPARTDGLQKGLPYPVRGEVQGRFGAERPDGGLWRGIVLRSDEGTAVHAVAAGRVVYANWLKGFGNLIIVDHGAKYLTVYAYNHSVLKQVGDAVRAGETIAKVGATGGQVESGLYFEIRHQGSPVNPLLWLKH
jgi:septal ring factor EnvC (AmiA/AmiB activator)